MPEFYMIFAGENIFPEFGGWANAPPLPLRPLYLSRLYCLH